MKFSTALIALVSITLSMATLGCQKSDVPDTTTGQNGGGNGGSGTPSNGNPDSETNNTDWTIPKELVFDGGPGKDGIPSIDNPQFEIGTSIDFLDDEDLVIGVKINQEIHVYPHPILDWHEIVNDKVGNQPIALNYCPLTGTAMAWSRVVLGEETTFGVSGLLYNSNLIPYDRKTDTNWSQMLFRGVGGTLVDTVAELYQAVETSWASWKKMYPNARVMTTNTGIARDYNRYPYGGYRTNDQLLFPIRSSDSRLHVKNRGLGIIGENKVKFYPLDRFKDGTHIVNETIRDDKIVVAANQSSNFAVAFYSTLEGGTELIFTALDESEDLKLLMTDQDGSVWNIFGEAVSGPFEGTRLSSPKSYIGYWFSWATFYPDLDIYQN